MREGPQTSSTMGSGRSCAIQDGPGLQVRIHGDAERPTLLHLPGLHGDWTLLGPFRKELAGRARLIETTYPRQTSWSLADYARAISGALVERGVTCCWILGESFSSQVAWELLAQQALLGSAKGFACEGLILVGGFVRHPWPWGVRWAHRASCRVPTWLLKGACASYGWLVHRRWPRPEERAELEEFVARRIAPADRPALNARYSLIAKNDPSETARRTTLPVFQLSGAMDPLVPWWQVRPWLRRHCPGYVSSRIIWRGGHNVLLSAPRPSVDQILTWVTTRGGGGKDAKGIKDIKNIKRI
jgi:pimeloyl-ACP methyl ester carboxylesterase